MQDPTISAIGVVSAVSIATSVVEISPFSVNGALVLANVQGVNERVFFRKLLLIAAVFVALGPGLVYVRLIGSDFVEALSVDMELDGILDILEEPLLVCL